MPAPDASPVPIRGCLVTATDTGVGKTLVAAAIAAALRTQGLSVAACKPVVTGTDHRDPGGAPADHELLAACTGQTPRAVTPWTFGPAVSPLRAAELAGVALDPVALLAHAREAARGVQVLVVEGVGGLLVPLTAAFCIRDYARALGLALVVVARPGLGTINHTRLTVEAARTTGLQVRAIVLTPWREPPTALEHDNATTLARLTGVPVWRLPHLPEVTIERLAEAGAAWPLQEWITPRKDPPGGR